MPIARGVVRISAAAVFAAALGGGVAGGDEPPAATQPPVSNSPGPEATERVTPFDGVTVDRTARTVEIRAWVCLDEGFLEQVACSPGTREHESLVVIRVKPSNIHAALLLAGHEPGAPGQWVQQGDSIELIPPQGPEFDVIVRFADSEGEQTEQPIRQWIQSHENGEAFPQVPWVFGGSAFRENPEFMGPGEHYVADMTGSIIGIVTFGDELLGLKQVISDQAAVHEPEWVVNTDAIPAEGTEVTIILRPIEHHDDAEAAAPERQEASEP